MNAPVSRFVDQKPLSSAKLISEQYARDGYVFPIDAFPFDQAGYYRRKLEELEARGEGHRLGNKGQLNFAHVLFRFAYEIVTSAAVLDPVEAVLGPDILLWGSTFFIKEPQTPSYVSWHQDLRYWGLEDSAEVSAWLAISPVTEANGCMRFVPGSHKLDILPHNDSFDDANFLTRGQEAQFDEAAAEKVLVELAPGQMSLHHGKLLHASGPNVSDDRRIGFTMNFIRPSARQVVASKDFAMLVRGEDRYGNFELIPAPDADLSETALA